MTLSDFQLEANSSIKTNSEALKAEHTVAHFIDEIWKQHQKVDLYNRRHYKMYFFFRLRKIIFTILSQGKADKLT